MKAVKSLSLLVISLLFAAAAASAQSTQFKYVKTWSASTNCTSSVAGQRGYGGLIREATFIYDKADETLEVNLNYDDCHGRLPDAFWLVVNDGPNPKGLRGELAILYFDASGATTSDDIEITVYGYNGQEYPQSWADGDRTTSGTQAPDRVISSLTDSSFVITKYRNDSPAGFDRTLGFKISTAKINSHVTAYPNPMFDFEGMAFDDTIGIWLHSFNLNSADSRYCGSNTNNTICKAVAPGQSAEGFFYAWSARDKGWYDVSHKQTNSSPYCKAEVQNASYNRQKGCYEVEIGDGFAADIKFQDPEGDDYTVTYSGLPPRTDTNFPSGSNFSSKTTLSIDWIAALSDAGKTYSPKFYGEDEHGTSQSCELKICVPENTPPKCELSVTSQNPNQCGGVETKIDFSANGTQDADGDDISLTWETTCADSSLNVAPNTFGASLTLTAPGLGDAVDCQVSVTVEDEFGQSETCSAPVAVEPCDIDCLGDPNGDAVIDECGVCDGDGTSCLDCLGNPNGDAEYDQCGVCNGNNDCLDCADIVDGTNVINGCGECVPADEADDLSSCIQCNSTDNFELQRTLDGNLKTMERWVRFYQRRALRFKKQLNGKTRGLRNKIRTDQKLANEAQVAGWVLSWQEINTVNEICDPVSGDTVTVECVLVSYEEPLSRYAGFSETLRDLGLKWTKRGRRFLKKSGSEARARRHFKKGRRLFTRLHRKGLNTAAQVPDGFSQCS